MSAAVNQKLMDKLVSLLVQSTSKVLLSVSDK